MNHSLPAAAIAASVNEALASNNTLVITAPPGAGKSTLLPLTIMQGFDATISSASVLAPITAPNSAPITAPITAPAREKILMLEPRRLAARQIAERMAATLGEPVGQTVGYRVRFEKKVSANTRIEVLTEGILTRMLVNDPTLDGVSAVIFDEFHERSLHSDLALALTRQAQELLRPDLRIIIMSATIDTHGICQALHAPLLESQGRMYPVAVHYADIDYDMRDISAATVACVRKAHADHDGDILVFLPGQAEITRCADMLSGTLGTTEVMPLYGNLPPERQRRAIAPSAPGERKVVLATPIAETSLTIEGVRIVIDSGLCRTLVFDARTGLSHLATQRISMDMAIQRMGRAGRVAEGICYRLWTKPSEHRMEQQRKAEILYADLTPMLLSIAAFGETDAFALPWLTPPPTGSIHRAAALLQSLSAIDAKGAVTPLGHRMAEMPCHPRIARMLLSSPTSLACSIAAVMEEKDPLADTAGSDLSLRLSALRKAKHSGTAGRWSRILQIAEEYRRLIQATADDSDPAPETIGALVACAYPERIAMATDSIGSYRLASGDNVRLDATDPLSAHQWLAIASLSVSDGAIGRVFLAAPVAKEDLMPLATMRDNISWDSKELRVVMQQEQRLGRLLLASRPLTTASRDTIIGIICEAVKRDGLSMFDWNDRVHLLQQRVAQVAAWHPEATFPDLSTDHLLATAEDWLPFYLEANGKLRLTAAEMKKIDLHDALWASIPYEQQQEIDRLAPTHIQVPTGSRIRIDYRQGASAPVLSVRLQECFGMADTPRINGGEQPLLIELLSPGFKPVQLTQDLRSFWQSTYFEVRKELKRRYPKHHWPENPLEAEAVRGVKR